MARDEKAASAIRSVSVEDRAAIASAIVDGLINPVGLTFEQLATEGGDYNQGQGDYNQTGGGNHNQSGGGYNQHAAFKENYLDLVTLGGLLRGVGQR